MMPAATPDEFFELVEGFEVYTPEKIALWLGYVETVHCPSSVWTDPIRQRMAVIFRAAHYLESHRQQMAKAASMGSTVSAGQTASPGTVSELELDQTTYGAQFRNLRKMLPVTGFTF